MSSLDTSAKAFSWVLVVLLLAALAWQVQDSRDKLEASRLLYKVEGISYSILATGQAPRQALAQNLRDLRRAGELDPLEVGVPLATGSQYLLMQSPNQAVEAYREALELEPRPEIYLNLGKALVMAGDRKAADEAFDKAVRLAPQLASEVPQ